MTTMSTRRFRMSIRGLMALVLAIAGYCGFLAHLRGWEARRAVMNEQWEMTRSILSEAEADVAAAGRLPAKFRYESDRATYTRRWRFGLEAIEDRAGRKLPLIRATVSGAIGE